MAMSFPELVVATGVKATDTANLQAAIDRNCGDYSAWSWRRGVVVLYGHFMLNAPLVMNSRATQAAKAPCLLVGLNGATLEYQGTTTNSSIISCYGTSKNRIPILDGLIFNCSYKCRGPLIDQCGSYRCTMRDVTVLYTNQVALDLVSCWGSHFENVKIINCRGIGLRTTHYISSGWRNLHVSQSPVEETYWPATDDTTVLDYAGNPIQTAVTERAAVILSGGNHVCHQTLFEGCYAETYPLMHVGTANSRISGIRMESNRYTNSSIVVSGGSDTDGRTVFSDIVGDWGHGGAGGKKSFLELRGHTRDIVVSDAELLGFGTAVVRATEGTHSGIQIQRVKTTSNTIPESSWVIAEGDAVVDATHSVIGSVRVRSTDAYLFGPDATVGSWRIIRSGDDLVLERYDVDAWVPKEIFSAS